MITCKRQLANFYSIQEIYNVCNVYNVCNGLPGWSIYDYYLLLETDGFDVLPQAID